MFVCILYVSRDWCIYITDAGQANHFYMVFDAARKAGWVTSQRLDHIGFGVVCGDDGKRFRTRCVLLLVMIVLFFVVSCSAE